MIKTLLTLALGALLVTSCTAQDAPANRPAAREVIERIQKNVGVSWRSQTVDTFKAGDPDTPVTTSKAKFSSDRIRGTPSFPPIKE